MRIGIDCRLWNETGVGRYIRNLVLNLQEIDKENSYILFILSKDKEEILKQVQNDNFRIIITDIKWHSVEEQIKFPQILNKENLDLMHFPYFSIPIFYNRPFVITIHDLIINHFSTGQASSLPLPIYNLKLLAYKLILAQSAKKAKKIIAVSKATKDEIIDHLRVAPEKIAVIHEGTELKNWKLEIGNWKLKNFPAGKFFLYVGNAFPHKNLNRLLEAFNLVCHPELRHLSGGKSSWRSSGFQNVKLVLVGKEDYFYRRLKNKVEEMGLSKKVIFLQNVSDKELSGLYQNAKALILPSLMEGFGLPALEAMANNCLVLASDIPALREVCGDVAIYFDPYNIKNMAEKMKEIQASDNAERKEKGLERVKLFSWRKMAKETLKVYESCVGV